MLVVHRTRVLTLAGLGLIACSGAAPPDIPDPTAESWAPSAGAVSTPAASSDASATPPAADGGTSDDAGAPPPSCPTEAEPNDSAAKATTFTSCISGKVTNAKDEDFLRIVAPAGAQAMLVEHQESGGTVLYRVSPEHGPSRFNANATFTGAAPEILVTPGTPYLLRLSFPGGKGEGGDSDRSRGRRYELAVTFR
jgi:hypothetical protein